MSEDNNTLKPCPFCGCVARVTKDGDIETHTSVVDIKVSDIGNPSCSTIGCPDESTEAVQGMPEVIYVNEENWYVNEDEIYNAAYILKSARDAEIEAEVNKVIELWDADITDMNVEIAKANKRIEELEGVLIEISGACDKYLSAKPLSLEDIIKLDTIKNRAQQALAGGTS